MSTTQPPYTVTAMHDKPINDKGVCNFITARGDITTALEVANSLATNEGVSKVVVNDNCGTIIREIIKW